MSGSQVASAPRIDIVSLEESLVAPYQEFAMREFGDEYQAWRSYLTWLYEEGPCARQGLGDAKVAVVGDAVVGCMHKLRLPWSTPLGQLEVASPHNLMVAPAHRTGAGFALISESLKGEKHALLLGVADTVQAVYERMGSRAIEVRAMRTVLNPFSAPLLYAARRFAPDSLDGAVARTLAMLDGSGLGSLRIHTRPSDALCEEIANALVQDGVGRSHVAWTGALVRWRFFHPRGPRHVLIRLAKGRGAERGAFALVSVGFRRGLGVLRVIEWHGTDAAEGKRLALSVRAFGTALGANAWLASTNDATAAELWRRAGFVAVPEPPTAYELHRPRSLSLAPLHLFGGASDAGFEAMPRDHR